tara:strand:+ start:550 stop:828 length:279 start_codon:yes stop_codon:yes gene_type:complete
MKGFKMINKIKELFQPTKRDFWAHIADARVNKNNPDYNLIKQAELLQKARIIVAGRKSKQLNRKVEANEVSPLEAYNWLDAWVLGQEIGVEI